MSFVLELGYDNEDGKFTRLSDFRRKNLSEIWDTLFSNLNRCLVGKESELDSEGTQSYRSWNLRVMKKKDTIIPFRRYIKLITRALMYNHHISTRTNEPSYEDRFMQTLHNDSRVIIKLSLDIPQDLLNLVD
ncbi:hypothetical protein Tco_1189429 [Tanacetum coccineum]